MYVIETHFFLEKKNSTETLLKETLVKVT